MRMRVDVPVAVPAEAAWELLGARFGEIAGWATPIVASSLDAEVPSVGVTRTCRFAGLGPFPGGVIQERLTAFDPETMSLAYRAESGMPRFVRRAVNQWSVQRDDPGLDSGQRCVIRVLASVDLAWWLRPAGPLLRRRIGRDAAGVLVDLVHRLETGDPHPRKVTRAGPAPCPGRIVR